MSTSNAAAIRRRAGTAANASTTPTKSNDSNQINQKTGLTLQQVISTFDKRLKTLEESTNSIGTQKENTLPDNILVEFNSRFEIIANEIADLKNALLKLQTFTMEVNKSLHDDRIRVLSDVNEEIANTATFSLEENSVEGKENKKDETQVNETVLQTENNLENLNQINENNNIIKEDEDK